MESMTNAPHLLMNQRQGTKFGDVLVRDHTAFDGLMDPWDGVSMGESTERSGTELGITREEQDEFAALSHQRAAGGAAVTAASPRRSCRSRPASARSTRWWTPTRASGPTPPRMSLGKLRPAFAKDGTITAGSSSPISDGAAAVVVMSRAKAEELGLSWLAEIVVARQRGRARTARCSRSRPTRSGTRSARPG